MPRRKKNRRWIAKLLILVVIVAGIYFVWKGFFGNKEIGDSGNDDEVQQVVATDGKESDDSAKTEEIKENVDEYIDKKPIQYDGGSPNELDYLTGVINYIHKNDEKLSIRVSIDQYLEDGTCELVLVRGEDVIYQDTAAIVGDATTSTCKGFDISVAKLTEGEAQFKVYFASGNRVGEVSGEVEI